jgi:hypothetical protein
MTTATAKLTREEAAYAYLASFAKDEHVIIGGRGRSCDEAVITYPQTFPSHRETPADAYLVATVTGIGGNGGNATISVQNLLSGRFHIEHDGDHRWNGEQTWFDADGYAAQNPEA